MSFFSGGKTKDKEPSVKKSKFYVEFLGWMECTGLRGQRYTGPVIRELRRRRKNMDAPPKLTIEVSRKDLKITQEVEEKQKRGIKKIKFPIIPARDVTFVQQATRAEDGRVSDIVACIYLGYMPRTQRCVHVHVYRFDEASTATLFVERMALIVEDNQEHIRDVELDLASRGEIDDPRIMPPEDTSEIRTTDSAVGSASSAYSDEEESSAFRNKEIEPDLQSLIDVQPFDSVADELKHRLHMGDAPLLLPPKDYDTISRARGNLEEINKRRCLNLNIVGVNALSRDRNGSNESGVDIASPGSDTGDNEEKGSENITYLKAPKLAEDRNSPSVSPQQKHKSLPLKEAKSSPNVPHRPKNLYESKHSPQVAHKMGFPGPLIPNSGLHSGNASPDSAHSLSGFVYPPKVTNSPMSPRMFPQPPRNNLSRQSSQGSHTSDNSKQINRSDDSRSGTPIQHYRYGSNDDIYAMPKKVSKQAATTDELPPDYQDDDEPQQPWINQPHGQQFLNRSLPADIIREKLKPGNSSRPNSEEMRLGLRTSSPIFMKGPPSQGSGGMYSPQIQRHGSSKR